MDISIRDTRRNHRHRSCVEIDIAGCVGNASTQEPTAEEEERK